MPTIYKLLNVTQKEDEFNLIQKNNDCYRNVLN